MSAWLGMWSYRIQERLTPARPKWLHIAMCSHCHGLVKWSRQQRRERAAS